MRIFEIGIHKLLQKTNGSRSANRSRLRSAEIAITTQRVDSVRTDRLNLSYSEAEEAKQQEEVEAAIEKMEVSSPIEQTDEEPKSEGKEEVRSSLASSEN